MKNERRRQITTTIITAKIITPKNKNNKNFGRKRITKEYIECYL